MKKIKILKAIIDFIWWVSVVGAAILLFILIGILFGLVELSPDFSVNRINISNLTIWQSTTIIVLSLFNLLGLYCLYLFRQIVHSFNLLKIFNLLIIKNFNKIGFYLLIIGVANILNTFLAHLFNNSIYLKIEFGFEISCICLGLFSITLSEIFNIAKSAKQENDLTI